MALILHIETATKVCSVALSKEGKCLDVIDSNGEEYSHGEELTVFIREIIDRSNYTLSDLTAVSISSGPGSYTGLRIGSATAKGLCYALGIPLIAIDSLACLNELVGSAYPGYNRCVVIDARRMEVFNCVYSEQGQALKEISADIIDENSYSQFDPMVTLGDGAAKLMDIWKDRNAVFDLNIVSSAAGQAQQAFEKFKMQEFVDLAYWEPFYLKDFVAGVKQKQL